ncbi:hypothetical protein [Streptomyces phytophilus]|uniref:hypothetical protein n=1 Tax=Streptomyces phytophilus TaxID=722715 RepID=UPI0015F00B6C|nr:hypothetical protein [Streptomyces phytophilus]
MFTQLHWALMVVLAVMVLPNAWATLAVARHRYESFHRWLQHTRAMGKLCDLLTDTAAEVRVHDAGGFLLTHHRLMSQAAEAEQERLAKLLSGLYLPDDGPILWDGVDAARGAKAPPRCRKKSSTSTAPCGTAARGSPP